MKVSKKARDEALTQLREWLKPGDTVYTILRHCSRSGMQRSIGLVVNVNGSMLHPNYSASMVTGYPQAQGDGLKVNGCGMDMGFVLVYELSRNLFPDGFGIEGEGPHGHKLRPQSKEDAEKAIAKGYKFRGRNGDASGWDDDGGYALRHQWL